MCITDQKPLSHLMGHINIFPLHKIMPWLKRSPLMMYHRNQHIIATHNIFYSKLTPKNNKLTVLFRFFIENIWIHKRVHIKFHHREDDHIVLSFSIGVITFYIKDQNFRKRDDELFLLEFGIFYNVWFEVLLEEFWNPDFCLGSWKI